MKITIEVQGDTPTPPNTDRPAWGIRGKCIECAGRPSEAVRCNDTTCSLWPPYTDTSAPRTGRLESLDTPANRHDSEQTTDGQGSMPGEV